MTPERWEQISNVYYRLLALTAEERCTIVAEVCGEDEELRAEVDSLLSADRSAGTFLLDGAMEDAAAELTGFAGLKFGDRIGCYRILDLIGAGGSGEVYRARDETLDRDVAVKLLNAEFAAVQDAALAREARVLASLNHNGIAAVYCLLEVSSTPAIVMECVEGPTLRDRLSRGPIPLNEALHLAHELASALEYAHERGIIHRDLNPANLKITADGNLKILDFGLAEFFQKTGAAEASSGIHAGQSMPGQPLVAGTPPYMAPEQMQGKSCDRRVDIWAFGVVLFELLAARRPWPGRTISELLDAVNQTEPDWRALPRGLPLFLRELLQRCLRKNPRSRLRDIGDARLAIEEYLANPTATPFAARRASFFWRGSASSAALLVLLAVLAGVAYRYVRPPALHPFLRVSLDLRPRAAMLTSWPNFALSRDSTKIVYTSRAQDGHFQLSVRRLDQQASTSLLAEGVFPFFSPDGRWIGFFANGVMKKVPAEGGASVVLCEAPDPRGGTWGDNDEIVFAGHSQGGLSRVSASGGEVSSVTELDTSAGELTHRWPQMLPGSNIVLFTAHNTLIDYDFATIQAQDLRTGRRQVLIRGGYFGRYFAPGYLLYVRSGTLFAAAMSLHPPKIMSSALPVIGPVDNSTISGLANLAVSEAGSLLYTQAASNGLRRKIWWLDEAGRMEPIRAVPGLYRSLRVSPNGKLLAFSLGRELGSDLWILDLNRSAMLRLTFAKGASECPVWTPDGNHIAFISNRDGRWRMYWTRVDGAGSAHPITDGALPVYPASFAPDGKHLCAIELNRKTSADVVILAIENAESDYPRVGLPEPFVSSPAVENHPSFSPDGHFISYMSAESRTEQVYVKAYPDYGAKWQISNEDGEKPIWSRSGHRLFYIGHSEGQVKIMVVDYRINGAAFIAGKPRSWSQEQLSFSDVYRDYDVAPDGRMAVYTEAAPAVNNDSGRLELLLNLSDELARRLHGTTR